jgi:hypothetical protein
MREAAPKVRVRAKIEVAEDLSNQVVEGVLDFTILYALQHRPEPKVELLVEETFAMVLPPSAVRRRRFLPTP